MDEMAIWVANMKHMSAKDAKNGFGLLLDTARAEPVIIEKHGRPVVVVLSVEQYYRLREHADLVANNSETTDTK